MRRPIGCRAAIAAAVGLVSAGALPAQVQVDGGTFEHSVAGAFAGSETFAVRRSGEDLVAVGRVSREGGPEALRAIEVGMRLDPDDRPIRYELHTREGPPLHVVVNRTGSRLRVTTTSMEGERFTEFLADDRTFVMEREVAHHYSFLARRLRQTADPRRLDARALLPSEARAVPVRVEEFARDTVVLRGTRVPSTRFRISVGEERADLWVAVEDGRVVQVAIPERRWTASRTSGP